MIFITVIVIAILVLLFLVVLLLSHRIDLLLDSSHHSAARANRLQAQRAFTADISASTCSAMQRLTDTTAEEEERRVAQPPVRHAAQIGGGSEIPG